VAPKVAVRQKDRGDWQQLESYSDRGPRKMPAQKPGLSKQDYSTPRDFVKAVEKRFGRIGFDLAATRFNTVADFFFGPPGETVGLNTTTSTGKWCRGVDSLALNWSKIRGKKTNLWLNPPFGHIEPWAKKCAEYVGPHQILFLVPASVGSEWFAKWVFNCARIHLLVGRLSFDGIAPYPKDCILCQYSGNGAIKGPEVELWRWRG